MSISGINLNIGAYLNYASGASKIKPSVPLESLPKPAPITASAPAMPKESLRDLSDEGYFKNLSHYDQVKISEVISAQEADTSTYTSLGNALTYQKQLDTNHDGVDSNTELQRQVNTLPNSQVQLKNFGTQLLSNYSGVSGLDNQPGISKNDLTSLASATGNNGTISGFDFMKVSNPGAYADYMQNLSDVTSIVDSLYGNVLA